MVFGVDSPSSDCSVDRRKYVHLCRVYILRPKYFRGRLFGIIFVDALSTSFESPNFTVICGFSEVWKHCGPKLFWLKENISSRYGLMELQRCHVSFSFTTPSNSPENLAAQFAVTCVHKEYHNLANSESNWSESESEKCQILCHSFFKYLAHIMANKGRCSLVIACRVLFRYH